METLIISCSCFETTWAEISPYTNFGYEQQSTMKKSWKGVEGIQVYSGGVVFQGTKDIEFKE